jgi:hypothetical protein
MLKVLRSRRRPPGPSALDLTTCSLSQLKDFVRHCVTLEHAWTSENASPRSHRQYTLPAGYEVLAPFTGSDLVLIWNHSTTETACLNLAAPGGICSEALFLGDIYTQSIVSVDAVTYTIIMYTDNDMQSDTGYIRPFTPSSALTQSTESLWCVYVASACLAQKKLLFSSNSTLG